MPYLGEAPQAIDLSRLPAPNIIEPLNFETLFGQFKTRFLAFWTQMRAIDPTLPQYDLTDLEAEPVVIVAQAWSYCRLLDRARVNDAVRSVFAPLAKGSDLDNVVARMNIQRLMVRPAAGTEPALMETDEALLRRYLLSFDAASAGSRDAYLFRAYTAWPGLHDASVIGRSIHGRRGDVDLVITAAGGATPTSEQINTVRAAVSQDHVKPEATAVTVIAARRAVYEVSLVIEIPRGPDPEAVRAEAEARVLAATQERNLIGGMVPADRIAGAAYGPNVIRVRRIEPAEDLPSDPYTIPVCGSLTITAEVAG